MINRMIVKVKEWDMDFVAMSKSYLAGLLGALTVFIVMHWFDTNHLRVGTVNITGLVDQFIKQESSENRSPEMLKKEVSVFGEQLERALRAYAKEQHLVLLPSEAVIAGSRDYTAIVRAKMRASEQRELSPNVE